MNDGVSPHFTVAGRLVLCVRNLRGITMIFG